jgi:hypothetical protein
MKIFLKYTVSYMIVLLFLHCSPPDDINMGSKNIEVKHLIQIEAKSSYKVNDILYINCSFSRYLPEKGYDTLLDIYKTTKSEEYFFNFDLEKKSTYGTWSPITIGKHLVVEKGKLNEYYGNTAICILNKVTNQYEFRGGIPLLEPGIYRIHISGFLNSVYTNNSSIKVNILTTIKNSDNQGSYNFTVTI